MHHFRKRRLQVPPKEREFGLHVGVTTDTLIDDGESISLAKPEIGKPGRPGDSSVQKPAIHTADAFATALAEKRFSKGLAARDLHPLA